MILITMFYILGILWKTFPGCYQSNYVMRSSFKELCNSDSIAIQNIIMQKSSNQKNKICKCIQMVVLTIKLLKSYDDRF